MSTQTLDTAVPHDEAREAEKPLRVLEFYSGIGGMWGAFDINTTANEVYRHNFPQSRLHQKQAADMYLMSPPCQPYTRLGNQQGSLDPRAKSFIYLLDIIGQLNQPPRYILVENVKGFEGIIIKLRALDQYCKPMSKLMYIHSIFLKLQEAIEANHEKTVEEFTQRIRDEAGLRYFTEYEIARLMGFPDTMDFPKSASRKQRYRVLGNSLSVDVVSALISWMLSSG
ncbi:S-adenosyl-L-methionine-dependent methyltransferase [Piptocephalis cylindrospora]|uniref:tRNA (cytosine(38)-C(5))-methyltransferase n=1 Tax=Piptocephalis cylindrospora TaxID=1907219 RepID=A0A4P9Y7N0_9FUNG|nr:S-adenosyl-L-methionine-dependent methyltransferase [Piptocephalis cylindrospora]|eukprot:RKP15146.1 S-adenosyl-L-methionine-dependent methyltransferase [Piptocephalis cylindrospora]